MDSNDVHRRWTARSGAYSPEYYAYYGPNETSELLAATIDRYVGDGDDADADADADDDSASGPTILELGCSSGRHLAHLLEQGYENVSGVEINGEAFEVMDETYPELAETGTFYHDSIESVVRGLDDDAFDVVYSVETLQHLHPDARWVFDELARVTGTLLVTVENEEMSDEGEAGRRSDADSETDDAGRTGDEEQTDDEERTDGPNVNYVEDDFPLYYRDWHDIFTGVGLTEVESKSLERDTFRAFTP
ncbi:class I SAM-dependent methyltransferase [Halogeometricum limi]|uniref:Methyltransferase domain-containing protein n=1 Tax=Halogeometricum limi TaxID=555875 RepID=A0A1I6ITZ5_9EURY|nr:class I SAM-dependent methyltransferase [Halogeometricum limi]SFR70214.1 Methyltransferase domain-containing protein [Halogeometricum limi]